jgi:hypothetical protein
MRKALLSLVLVALVILATATVASGTSALEAEIQDMMDIINAQLALEGADYQVVMAELLTTGEDGEMGITVLLRDLGNKQLSFDFVPFDARRAWSGPVDGAYDDITYAVDQTGDAVPPLGGLTKAESTAAIHSSMVTWDDVGCSTLPISQNSDLGLDLGLFAYLLGSGGSANVVADIQQAGFTDIIFCCGVLGATFTFGFVDSNGDWTDIDNNGKHDTALREIYYDPSWSWKNDGSDVDLETVALHEAGHGLSQAHFGRIVIDNHGDIRTSPEAVMNAIYGGVRRSLLGTDVGGHCSNWAEWPNN